MKKINLDDFKEKVLLLCHENADLDSFCSALIFKEFLKNNKIKSKIAIPSHINEDALNFAIKENIDFLINPSLEEYNTICLFDFNDYEQLGKIVKEFKKVKNKKIIVFDHHEKEKRFIGKGYIYPKYFSTTQILSELLEGMMSPKMCFYSCLGMVEDTGRFIVGSKHFFKTFSYCLSKSNRTYSEIFSLSKHIIPEGEKIAFLKAIKRSKIIKINKSVLITSKLSFYQGAAATKLLEFGAHISLVVGKEDNGLTHLSARAETFYKEKNNFNLMKDLMIPLQKEGGGDVGGHSGAAQWKGNKNENDVIKIALKILEKKLQKSKG